MKTMNYQGHEIELTAVSFRFAEETILQEGVLVHDTTDEFSDGDAIYGNGWTLDAIQDKSDLESLLTSGDGSTYITRNDDGTYSMDA